jgi:hypothetical protein
VRSDEASVAYDIPEVLILGCDFVGGPSLVGRLLGVGPQVFRTFMT